MKNTIKLFGLIALVAAIGFSFAGCEPEVEDDTDTLLPAGTYTGTSFDFSTSQGYGGQMGSSDYLSGNASAITLTVGPGTSLSTNNEGGLFKLYGGGRYYGYEVVNKTAGTFAITSKLMSGGSYTLYKPEPPSFLQPATTLFGGTYNSTAGTITIALTYFENTSIYTTGTLVLTKQP